MNDNLGRIHFTVRGRVQGVGFRYFLCSEANRMGLVGWVKNNPDSTVEGELQGGLDKLEDVQEILRKGPSWSRVDELVSKRMLPISAIEDRVEIRSD